MPEAFHEFLTGFLWGIFDPNPDEKQCQLANDHQQGSIQDNFTEGLRCVPEQPDYIAEDQNERHVGTEAIRAPTGLDGLALHEVAEAWTHHHANICYRSN